jgi:4-hydroxybutyrate CoA-transferase
VNTPWESRAVSASDAVASLARGMRIFVHGAAATPTVLLEALTGRRDLEAATLYHLHTAGPAPYAEPEHAGRFRSVSFFVGAPLPRAVTEGRANFMPIFMSQIPSLFSSGRIALDAALVTLSPPDRHGLCTLGTSVDAARAAADHAGLLIAEINDRMPRTHGATTVPIDRVHAFVHTSRPPHVHRPTAEAPVYARIGELVARLVDDGAMIQIGVGGIRDSALRRLADKHDLGVHTEMFSDGIIDLIEQGVITNRLKTGSVNLHALTLGERGDALVSIAHPDFRAELRRDLAAIKHMPVSRGLSAFERVTEPQVVQ